MGNILSRNLTKKSLKKIQGYRISPSEKQRSAVLNLGDILSKNLTRKSLRKLQQIQKSSFTSSLKARRRNALRDILTRKSLRKLQQRQKSSSKRKKAGLTILKSLRKNTSRLRKLNIKPKERINIFDKVIKEIPKAVKKKIYETRITKL